MQIDVWFMFSVIAITNIVSPGPAILLAISNGLTQGLKSVAISSLGNITGLFLVSSVAMIGLGTILKTSSLLFTVFKVVGAIYLIYLGVKSFNNRHNQLGEVSQANGPRKNKRKLFKEGFLIASTNPKAVIFFTALFPLFLDTQAPVIPQFFILTMTFMLYSYISLVGYGWLSKSIKNWLNAGKRMVWFHKITGGLFISLGLGLLTVRNANAN